MGKIQDQRGWTRQQVLWGESWINLLMQQADAVRYVNGKKSAPVIETKEDLERILGKRNGRGTS